MVVPVTTIGSCTVPRRMAGTVAGHDMKQIPWIIVIETWYQAAFPRNAFCISDRNCASSPSSRQGIRGVSSKIS